MNIHFKVLSFLLFLSALISCSKDESSTPTVNDPNDTWSAWSSWSPEFSDQTSNFTQTRNRSVVINGNADSTPPSGESTESRNIVVSSSSVIQEDNERTTTFNLDLNNDGDFVDYVQREITTYTASNGLGDFSVTSEWSVSIDQVEYFWTLNYGDWGTSLYDEDGEFLFDHLVLMRDRLEDCTTGNRYESEDCFQMYTVEESFSEIPYDDYDIISELSTELSYNLYDIDLGQWFDDSSLNGILVDYIVEWNTDDEAGNQTIQYLELVYLAYSTTGNYDSSNIVTAVIGDLERLDSSTDFTLCNSSSSKSLKQKRSYEYLLKRIDKTKLPITQL